ncbi:2-oxo acid dehydrogenase subunit E2 [Nocardia sp. NBC_01730]|uniref:2-oxo acid dehydrogenase subunit E2 n=1 Tax=Nocardia sp. NBC_01730 TaxID=2975998 RepID=UPI002E11ECE1|nr:2-oxo acid dehydrogenase subunit E2 [Nocardia sp. NBC_01730]
MAEFRMPSLGADMDQGTLLHWHVHPGDPVRKGDIVAEVDTAKAAIEVECFDDGTIGEILVPEGATVPVGARLATIEPAVGTSEPGHPGTVIPTTEGPTTATSSEAPSNTETPATAGSSPASAAKPVRRARRGTRTKGGAVAKRPRPGAGARSSPKKVDSAAEPDTNVHATPLIRRLAQEAGIDIASIEGSGPDRRILRADIARAIAGGAGRPPASPPRPPAATTASRATVARQSTTPEQVLASGYARRLAEDLGVDLAGVHGSGPGGAVLADDVRGAQARLRTAIAGSEVTEHEDISVAVGAETAGGTAAPQRDPDAMRRAIAMAMTHSKQTIPHYYLSSTIDLAAATDWLREVNEAAPVSDRLIMAALQLRAVALAARKVPAVNGHWIDDAFHSADTVDIGTIVSLRTGGILAPTIAGADTTGLRELMARLRGAVGRARSVRLLSSDTAPASITVTNLGELGVDSVTGVIPPPQVAIVGFGAVTDRPCAVGGLLGVRPQVMVTLAADHRASDGTVGARFLNTIAELLQHPERL